MIDNVCSASEVRLLLFAVTTIEYCDHSWFDTSRESTVTTTRNRSFRRSYRNGMPEGVVPVVYESTVANPNHPGALHFVHYASYGDSGCILHHGKTPKRRLWWYTHHHSRRFRSQTLHTVGSHPHTHHFDPPRPAYTHSVRTNLMSHRWVITRLWAWSLGSELVTRAMN